MVEALQLEAKNNPVFRDICHMFTLRQRTRGRLTVTRLKTAMEEEGFNYSRKQYEEVLKFMGKIGIGQLDFSKRGLVKSLNNVKLKLQSIGTAALSQNASLQSRRQVNRYDTLAPVQPIQNEAPVAETKPLIAPKPIKLKRKIAPAKPVEKTSEKSYPMYLTMELDGQTVKIPTTAKVTATEIGEFIAEFQKLAEKKDASL